MAEEENEQEYQVESIVTHLEYVEAFELRGYIVFNPSSCNGSTHSKYVYLVKWVGYDEADNTWEPEENLVDCTELLTIYKQKHGLPLYHETFNRRFNWKEPTSSLTLAEVNRRAFKNRDPVTSASQLVRDPPTKKKRRTKVKPCAFGCSDLDDELIELDVSEYDSAPRKKSKLSPVKISTPKSEVKKRGPKKRITADGVPAKRPGRKPRAASLTLEKKEKPPETENRVEVVRYIVEGTSHRSRSPVKRLLNSRRYSSAERLPERWFKAFGENAIDECIKMTREKLAKMLTTHFVNSTEELLDRRKMIVCMREKEESSAENEQRQYRVVGSSLVKKLLKENGIPIKLPIPPPPSTVESDAVAKVADHPVGSSEIEENSYPNAQTNGLVSSRAGSSGSECSLAELRMYAHESSLTDSANFLKVVRKKDVPLADDELLIIALSYAELSYKVTIRVLRSVADERKRLAIIKDLVENVPIIGNTNLSRPQRLEEPSSSLASQLVESDLADGGWFEAISHCSAVHWKCRLLYQLIAVCPVPEVFVDPSSPFNTKQFLHCMRYGAHCQKLAFVKSGVPFELEAIPFDYFGVSVNHCHIAAMQRNPRYFLEFLKNGFDVCSLTTKPSPSRMDVDLTVCTFLERLAASKNSGSICGEPVPELTDEIQKHITNVIGIVSDWESVLQAFIRDSVERRLKCDQRCEVTFDRTVSPVHTLRVCSSQPHEISVRTAFFGNISTPILTRILNMVHSGKSAVVLCVYTVSIGCQLPAQSSPEGCALPLHVSRKLIPDCSVHEARLHDIFSNQYFTLLPDESSTSDSEWYFVLDTESLSE
ncbi:hypothetical protein Y032_0008g189 [Ancylostoma ceylanicum]|uniref:Chromo domain-containing protein n=1 Tax=Ancylostoma ceylanicum TaxID=53326 RepID=A0A016VK35_9BILA|nr:hypothetical protein Y032_0008g189 [Ancylostoma ceylanicum]